jgi:8-hydroxy-5-deazaflavin:NADPH oxidoreductase
LPCEPPHHPTFLGRASAGDDAKAKSLVIRMTEKLGFTPLDTGGLADGGRRQQAGNLIYAADLTAKQAREALTQ